MILKYGVEESPFHCVPTQCSPIYIFELCGTPRSAGDYLTLAELFHSFIITDIPYLSIDARNEVRRFITFFRCSL